MYKIAPALGVAGLVLAACASPVGVGEIVGEYNLISIDGNPLPTTPAHQGGAPQVLASTLSLAQDGTFRMTMTYAGPGGKAVTRDFRGTYSTTGEGIRMVWDGAGVTTATVDATRLVLMNEGMAFAY
jgi:hypothetical protein